MRKTFMLFFVFSLLASSFSVHARPAAPHNQITVTNLNDSGAGSLRQAIADANPGDAIVFDSSLNGVIPLNYDDLDIAKNLTITGPGVDKISLSGLDLSGVFDIHGTNTVVTITNLTITQGEAKEGGGVRNEGDLRLSDVVITNSYSPGSYGGGVYSTGSLSLERTTLKGNSAGKAGGGVYVAAGGRLAMTDTLIYSNSANHYGAGLYLAGSGTIDRSLFHINYLNDSDGVGAGIFLLDNTLAISNTTFYKNEAWNIGAAIHAISGTLTCTHCTFNANEAHTGEPAIVASAGTVELRSSIIANTDGGPNCGSDVIDGGYNLQYGGTVASSCGAAIPVANPMLAPLGDIGGYAQGHALLDGSAAIDSVPILTTAGLTACYHGPTLDQRRTSRPQGSLCDAGSFELVPNSTRLFLPAIHTP